MNWVEQIIEFFVALLIVFLLGGCVGPVVTKKEEASCSVPATVVQPVDGPKKLMPGARNEDMKTRMDLLEGALAICNARLADVPQALQRGKPPPEPTKPGLVDRLLGIFR